jgi:predicted DsbA family dithiol-disulfide isomerase
MGISGVPCAIFNQSFAVMGAQSVEAYIQALDQAAFGPPQAA